MPVIIICKKHGEFEQVPDDHLSGSTCPWCTISKGEEKIRQYLNLIGIEFEYQKRFNKCKDIGVLPFDFYLSQHNLLIEYDGEQHFFPVPFSKRYIEDFKHTQRRDKIRNEFAKKNKIGLLRIPYTEFKNIERLLENEIEKRAC